MSSPTSSWAEHQKYALLVASSVGEVLDMRKRNRRSRPPDLQCKRLPNCSAFPQSTAACLAAPRDSNQTPVTHKASPKMKNISCNINVWVAVVLLAVAS